MGDVDKLQRRLEKTLAKTFGKRCKTKDTDDFPELKDGNGRCPACLVYEELDHFMVALTRRLSHGT